MDDDTEDVEERSLARVMQRWKAEEEKLLCETWIEVSESNAIGADRNLDTFWWQVTHLADLEMIIDKGDASSDTLHKRADVVKLIQEVDKLCAMEASQKAKIKWAIEGDENSKYYHGILNKKRNQLSIRGVLVEGDKNRFDRPKPVRPMLNMEFPHHLNSMQQLDLEAEVSNEEIKKAVWDCGVDKSPGPNGFTFGFYKTFWSLIEKDMLAAVKYFFHYSRIPKGCNSSFIALIFRKTHRSKKW
ncbi:hypothetical protein Tco_0848216 [Tanacetum coccineum]